MDATLKIWATNRKNIAGFVAQFSLAQLNHIPSGFSNNLVWNLGHIVVVQQRLLYSVAGLPMAISATMLDQYKTGSKPMSNTTQEEVDQLKLLLHSVVESTLADYKSGKFATYKEFTTATGFLITSIDDAIVFNNYHEGLHLGLMMNIRKFI
ncbi:MAG: hypothetical protein RL060_912 [Bacteroidota bacterium]|jgi:hypothetical protein